MKEQVIDTDGQVLIKTTYYNCYIYYLNAKNQYHRIGGSAIIWSNGSQEYWVDGKKHRTDGPAYIDSNGNEEYWVNNKLHRLDGPARIRSTGLKEYWVEGNYYPDEKYPKAVLAYKLKQFIG
jgi:hypothetical protein